MPTGLPIPNPRPSSRAGRLALAGRRLSGGWTLFGYSLALLTATHWPMDFRTERTIGGIAIDHVVHGLLYAPLAMLLVGFLGQRAVDSLWRRWRWMIAPAVLLAAAALDEWTQPAVGRSCNLSDWIGDAMGITAATAVSVASALVRRRLARPSPTP